MVQATFCWPWPRGIPPVQFRGVDVSPDARALWPDQRPPNLVLFQRDITPDEDGKQDIALIIDVFEHVEDYLGFLRRIRSYAEYFIFHIPLDLHVQGLLRDALPIARRDLGHLHYFCRSTALATLHDTGYLIVDERITFGQSALRHKRASVARKDSAMSRG